MRAGTQTSGRGIYPSIVATVRRMLRSESWRSFKANGRQISGSSLTRSITARFRTSQFLFFNKALISSGTLASASSMALPHSGPIVGSIGQDKGSLGSGPGPPTSSPMNLSRGESSIVEKPSFSVILLSFFVNLATSSGEISRTCSLESSGMLSPGTSRLASACELFIASPTAASANSSTAASLSKITSWISMGTNSEVTSGTWMSGVAATSSHICASEPSKIFSGTTTGGSRNLRAPLDCFRMEKETTEVLPYIDKVSKSGRPNFTRTEGPFFVTAIGFVCFGSDAF
mmetsp:Transcript_9312/g.16028  ORF Transcript_9312/g.16028 Transcript_9312/m.16028 type:complete len:288 (-) Transcript_9312:322-1185(-)